MLSVEQLPKKLVHCVQILLELSNNNKHIWNDIYFYCSRVEAEISLNNIRVKEKIWVSMGIWVKWSFKSYFTQFISQQVPQQKRVRGVSHQEAILAHNLDFFYLITIVGLQNYPTSCREVPHYHLEKT